MRDIRENQTTEDKMKANQKVKQMMRDIRENQTTEDKMKVNQKDKQRKRGIRENQTIEDKMKANRKSKETMRHRRKSTIPMQHLNYSQSNPTNQQSNKNTTTRRRSTNTNNITSQNIPNDEKKLSKSVKIEEPMKEAFEALNRTKVDEGEIHSLIICVICGR